MKKNIIFFLLLTFACDDGSLPEEELCHPDAYGWPNDWSEYENEVLSLINELRGEGATCFDSEGNGTDYPSADPLEMEPNLRCAARVHSKWMTENGMQHDSPGGPLGDDPWERMENAGYEGNPMSENIAAGYSTPEDVVAGWMSSTAGHCTAIMNENTNQIGVGYAQDSDADYSHFWTLDFGRQQSE